MVDPSACDGAGTVIFDPRNTSQTVPSGDLVLRDRHGVECMALVDCESFKTIALRVSGGSFSRGDAVEAEYGGAKIPAVVRRVAAQADGLWNLVLRWGT